MSITLNFPSLQKAVCGLSLYKPKCQICQHFFGSMNSYWWEMLWNFLLWKKPFANHSLVQAQVLNQTTVSWRHGRLNGYWWAFIWNFLLCRKLFANCLCTNSSVKFTSTFHGDIHSRLNNGYWWALIWNHLLCRKLLDDHSCTNSIKFFNFEDPQVFSNSFQCIIIMIFYFAGL